jgi:hypothetical protein
MVLMEAPRTERSSVGDRGWPDAYAASPASQADPEAEEDLRELERVVMWLIRGVPVFHG